MLGQEAHAGLARSAESLDGSVLCLVYSIPTCTLHSNCTFRDEGEFKRISVLTYDTLFQIYRHRTPSKLGPFESILQRLKQ
jgi:hypothetical protein